ncbi:DNA adenine methylase [Providencia hangzhouensis]|uniref:DNA adenine methylase n=1 Tax=Providencia hangzhouensis TaxID=3031799 RepID=UPI0034DD6D19
MSKINKTILKWAGSKVRIMEQLRPHLPKTNYLVEPFAGSCAVMMNTDYDAYLIADVNADLINLYTQIIESPQLFIADTKRWFKGQNDEDGYYHSRSLFNYFKSEFALLDEIQATPREMATLFLYLNRHGYNGLCRYNKEGGFNVPFGKYKQPYFPEDEINAFVLKAKKSIITNLEWQDTLSLAECDDGIYCDPPYMGDNFTQYHAAGFNDADHETLAIALKDLNDNQGNPITVSNSILAKELYSDLGFVIHEIDAPRSIAGNGNRQTAKEIIAVLEGCL